MKENIISVFSIILILLFITQFICGYNYSKSSYCKNSSFSIYISMVECVFKKKYSVVLKGDEIPEEKCNLIYEKLQEYIKSLEKNQNRDKMEIWILYDEKMKKFTISSIKKSKSNTNPKYI